MPRLYRAVALLAILALAGFSLAVQADTPRGVFGIGLNVDGEGFFLNPTLKSITITEVRKGMPAEAAGIAVGDQIVEVEGKTSQAPRPKTCSPTCAARRVTSRTCASSAQMARLIPSP
jgi:predicted metalloprotease with PDZ domain